jgi:SAM-dependent methyltransferase
MAEWWQTYFDTDYLRLDTEAEERADREAAGLWAVLGLQHSDRVLDAPCGNGRISVRLARRGAVVVGVDFSAEQLDAAQRQRGDIPPGRLRYLQQDLRQPLHAQPFDAAINIFTSLGYGTEADDMAVLSTLRSALREQGHLFIETAHRDRIAVALSQGQNHARRLPDQTLVMEETRFDAVSGRADSTRYYNGPSGSGQKHSSVRIYAATELVRLIETAGFRLVSIHDGCSPAPFVASGPTMSNRIGILAQRD